MAKVRNNLIKGAKLLFGDPAQIKWVKEHSEMLAGTRAVCELEWHFIHDTGNAKHNGAPLTFYREPKKANAVMAYVYCPRCGRIHKHIVAYDPQALQIEEWHAIESVDIICYNCHLEMMVCPEGNNLIYVKVETN
ncbi:MAG: hypothetical protein L6Q66_12935 [Bacteroidia bacterium]|nr:hypothetical protein [Bacteroidia bacterium]